MNELIKRVTIATNMKAIKSGLFYNLQLPCVNNKNTQEDEKVLLRADA